jgi:2-polyprenyl-6-hydroxyphenyl methylase/3-demethylubiquinone-9 3-methyltransferase
MVALATQLAKSHGYSDQLKFERVNTIASIAVDNSSLDGILCSSVLEYVSNPAACLAEFSRVLKPGGVLLVSVPNRHSVVRRLQLTCHHLGSLAGAGWAKFLDYSCQHYSRPEFERMLTQAGFSVNKILPFGSPLPGLAQRSRRWAPLMMFVAHKAV